MEPIQRYEAIISAIYLDTIYYVVSKNLLLEAPVELNYPAMIMVLLINKSTFE